MGTGIGRDGLSVGVEAQLERYLSELERWGRRVNLVGSTDRGALQLHLRDSLAAVPLIEPGDLIVDLGSGAGLPGLPLAIARGDARFVLVEARERRVHFLRHVARTLGLSCEVRRQRIEEGPRREGERFRVAMARAVGPVAEVARQARGWVDEAGEVWIWTREDPEACGVREGIRVPIDPGSARGHVLRIPAHAIPRGTLTD